METFVVRVWTEAPASATEPIALRGIVQHVRSGASHTFARPEDLVEYLRRAAADPPPRPERGS